MTHLLVKGFRNPGQQLLDAERFFVELINHLSFFILHQNPFASSTFSLQKTIDPLFFSIRDPLGHRMAMTTDDLTH
jgi:hypothetical protein